MNLLRNLPKFIACPFVALLSLFQVACSSAEITESGNLVSDALALVSTGASDYQSVQAALSGAQQSIGAHGISLGNIATYASAIATPANGQLGESVVTNLGNAVAVVQSDVQSLIAGGATPAAVSANITQAQTSLPVTPTPASTQLYQPAKVETASV